MLIWTILLGYIELILKSLESDGGKRVQLGGWGGQPELISFTQSLLYFLIIDMSGWCQRRAATFVCLKRTQVVNIIRIYRTDQLNVHCFTMFNLNSFKSKNKARCTSKPGTFIVLFIIQTKSLKQDECFYYIRKSSHIMILALRCSWNWTSSFLF